MKKITAMFIAALMLLALTACGGDDAETTANSYKIEVPTETETETERNPIIPVAKDFSWTLAGGILTVSGNGNMPEFAKKEEVPWAERTAEVEQILITEGIKSISAYAFEGCENLKSVQLPDSLTSIGMLAFDRCSSLESITIPKDVSKIGYWAFGMCGKLSEINFGGNVETWKSFGGDGELGTFSATIRCSDGEL